MRLALCLAAGLACGLALPLPALANDGFGGLAATGLTFGRTDAVAMEEEDLFIGLDRVQVRYVFRNRTEQDVTGEVIFPLPPISLPAMMNQAMNLPADLSRDNLVGFTARVDGAEVPVTVDRIAVIEPPWDAATPASAQYDTPGRDVTADLARFGMPLSIDWEEVVARIAAMDRATQDAMVAAGLMEVYDAGEAREFWPSWAIVLRYHWTQTFPAGQAVVVEHGYSNHPPGGLFGWEDPPQADYLREIQARYCVDAGTSRAIAKAIRRDDGQGGSYLMGTAYDIAYVLRTANSWAGPIGRFRLTLDKGAPGNVISFCGEGVRKTGPTTFTVEKTNYAPDRDLEVLVVVPVPAE